LYFCFTEKYKFLNKHIFHELSVTVICVVIFQKIYENHVTFGGEGGSKSGLKQATWFVYGP